MGFLLETDCVAEYREILQRVLAHYAEEDFRFIRVQDGLGIVLLSAEGRKDEIRQEVVL